MKWFVDVKTNFDSSVKLNYRKGDLCRFLRSLDGGLIENDVHRMMLEGEIEAKVQELNGRDAEDQKIVLEKIDFTDKKLWPVCYNFYSNDDFYSKDCQALDFHVAVVFLRPVLFTYHPEGGEQ